MHGTEAHVHAAAAKARGLLALFDDLSPAAQWHRVVAGLHAPRGSGERKYAHQQLQRLWAVFSGLLGPFLVVLLFMLIPAPRVPRAEPLVVMLRSEPPPVTDMDELPPLPPPPDMRAIATGPDLGGMEHTVDPGSAAGLATAPPSPLAPVGELIHPIRSPARLQMPMQNRAPGARDQARSQYHAPPAAETAVLRALRWLKACQNPDGGWTLASGAGGAGPEGDPAPAASTGFALLCLLGHGETAESPEFGATVKAAIEWLLDHRAADGGWKRHYEHAIATYALAEASAMCPIPRVRDAAAAGAAIIVAGQNATGGWNYPLTPGDRDDTSVMAWCVQALKAARIAQLDSPGLEESLSRAVPAFRKNADPEGGFGYVSTGPALGQVKATGLTGAGVLCMQFLGASRSAEVRGGLRYLRTRREAFDLDTATWRDFYWWYYDTQARFHAGGAPWDDWNAAYLPQLAARQTTVRAADGKMLGFWTSREDRYGPLLNTCLCALQLEVYYRYLPTYGSQAVDRAPDESEGETVIEIQMNDKA